MGCVDRGQEILVVSQGRDVERNKDQKALDREATSLDVGPSVKYAGSKTRETFLRVGGGGGWGRGGIGMGLTIQKVLASRKNGSRPERVRVCFRSFSDLHRQKG